MLRQIIILGVIAYASSAKIYECRAGESYWCQTLSTASQCDAVQHCMTNVWLKQKRVKDSNDTCQVCEQVFVKIKALLANKQTQDEMKSALLSVCQSFPDIAKDCEEVVNKEFSIIINMVENDMDPKEICNILGMCGSRNKMAKMLQQIISKFKSEVNVKGSGDCNMCKTVVQYVENTLSSKPSEAEIEAALDAVCDQFPAILQSVCQTFVAEYTPKLLQLLKEMQPPEEICEELDLCSSNAVKSPDTNTKVSGGGECDICEMLMKYLKSVLSEKPTVKEIEDALDEVCSIIPAASTECKSFVDKYTRTIVNLLVQGVTPAEVCQAIGLCSADDKSLGNDLLGRNKCSWGPAYWCTSRETARNCNAEAHCVKHVWN